MLLREDLGSKNRFVGMKVLLSTRPLKNTLFVIASEAKQSRNQLIIKEIATAHTRLAMTGNEFFKGLDISISFHQ